jgi:signal transduction histidine kinase
VDQVNDALSVLTALSFAVLAILAVKRAATRRAGMAARWLAGAFMVIAIVTVAGFFLPETNRSELETWIVKVEIVLLALFPFFLYRFALTFRDLSRPLRMMVDSFTVVISIWALLLPDIPGEGEPRSRSFLIFTILFIAHFSFVTMVVAANLWRAGSRKPGAIRSRMRTMAIGAFSLAIALILAGPGDNEVLEVITGALALVSGVTFALGYMPPSVLRVVWRRRDQELFQIAIAGLMRADSQEEITGLLLPRAAALVGGNSAALVDPEGSPIASWKLEERLIRAAADKLPDHATAGAEDHRNVMGEQGLLAHWHQGGWVLVGVDAYTPFFGREETYLIDAILSLYNLARARVDVLEREREAVRRLRDLDQMKTEFVAMVAHDLRSPMSVISGFADTLRLHGETLTKDQRDQYLSMISDTVQTLAVLVEDVLQVARIEAGEYSYEIRDIELRPLLERVVAEQRTIHPGRAIEIDAAVQEAHALADPERVLQVLTNFITNAIKFSPPDSVVHISLEEHDEGVYVKVRDEGMGIKPADMPRLFQKFSRISPPDGGPKVKGTGLGLYICRSIVEALGGRIWAESEPGEGSTFGFSLPAAVREEAHT